MNNNPSPGFAGTLSRIFVASKLTPLAIIASLLLGVLAITQLPREEEPQIQVPMIDVLVTMPGATPKEVEERLSIPMEKLLYELPGVEYIYSTSTHGQSLLVVRFYVGEDIESSIVRLNQKLATNFDRIPHTVSRPLIKPHTIDDVPILALTFHGGSYDHFTLRKMATQIDHTIKSIHDVAETKVIGGTRREVRILFDPLRLSSRNLTALDLISKLQEANLQSHAGSLISHNKEVLLQTGNFLENSEEIGKIVVGVHQEKPVYLHEVAAVLDGPEEPQTYVLHGSRDLPEKQAAVTLSVAKRPGANAVEVVESVLKKVQDLKGVLIPLDMKMTISRNYGETAAEKSNELLFHMGIAVFGVALLILFFLGWRESMVVLLAIPSTLALTLLIFYLYGYTLNRITLFALIFSIGILVDDAIVVVENIVRHMRLTKNGEKKLTEIAIEAVQEVGNPTILATWAVIAAILPMAFVGGLMGPYMRPIPVGASAAMIFSLLIAFSVTPWAATHILKNRKISHHHANVESQDVFTRLYHLLMEPLLARGLYRLIFFASILLLLLLSCSMVTLGLVKVKMLPFDNKSEFQVVLDMPEGTTLEQTARVAMEMADEIARDPAVDNYQIYTGTASPYNFNGLVRHYFLRKGSTVADIQVNLLPKHDREQQSHAIAQRIRPELAKIAQQYGATLAVAEVPPGPPVLQTLVAEVYGPNERARVMLAEEVKHIFETTKGVVDIDWYREEERLRKIITVDKEKAALNGITEKQITRTIEIAMSGLSIDLFHQPAELEEINIILELPLHLQSNLDSLLNISMRSEDSTNDSLIPLRELVRIKEARVDQPIYRKNLKPVVYVTGDISYELESPVYAILEMNKRLSSLSTKEYGGVGQSLTIYNLNQPFSTEEPTMKWDGEWHITLEVFRDLGLAFLVVMLLIYMLMVGWFKDYLTPFVVMAAIPFSLIGILPAHWAFGAFFSATSMIGFMAGAGIVVRNSIILVDFIELRIQQGLTLSAAVVEAGAVRFRPMLLTALAVVVGASVILADPIFQGLAISLMFGEIASLFVSRMAVPVLYFLLKKED